MVTGGCGCVQLFVSGKAGRGVTPFWPDAIVPGSCTRPSPDVPHPISLKTWLFSNPFFYFSPGFPVSPTTTTTNSHLYTLSLVHPLLPRSPLLWHPRAIVAAGARPPRGSDGGQTFIQLRVTAYSWTKREGMEEKREGSCHILLVTTLSKNSRLNKIEWELGKTGLIISQGSSHICSYEVVF